jgi:Rrf2 family protein
MRVSAKTDYALRALLEMSSRDDGKPVSAEELGRLQGIPHGFLQAILADLRKAGVVIAQRGQSGGWRMNRDPKDVSVADVIRAVDGPLGSVAGHAPEDMEYQGHTMRLRDTWVAVRASVRGVLEGITLDDIASDHLPDSISRLLDGTDAWVRR